MIESNNNIFINFKKEIIITFYIDNVLIINHNKVVIKRIKNVLNDKFHILNLKLYAFYLSIIIKKNRYNDIIRLKKKRTSHVFLIILNVKISSLLIYHSKSIAN